MDIEQEQPKPIQFIRNLCKEANELEILEAENNLRELLLVINEMCDRFESSASIEESFDAN